MRALTCTITVVVLLGCGGESFSSGAVDDDLLGAGGAGQEVDGGAMGLGGRSSAGGKASGSGGAPGSGGSRAGAGGAANAAGGTANSSGGTVNAAGGTANSSGGTVNAAGGHASGSGGAVGAAGGNANAAGGTANSTGGAVNAAGGAPGGVTSCPIEPPDPSAACEGDFSCTYGTDPRPACRSTYQCTGKAFLVTVPRCVPPKSCLSDFAPLPVIGGDCISQGDSCSWDSGLTCACVPCLNGESCLSWYCYPGPADPCPVVPPNQGQACEASATVDCLYAFCGAPEHLRARCSGGTWGWEVPACN